MIKKIMKYLIMFALGMCTYGFIQSAILVVRGRVGTVGGEILVIPFMFGLIYIGWFFADTYLTEKYKNIVRQAFKRGFAIGTAETIKDQYKEKQG